MKTNTCSVEGCDRRANARELCAGHAQRLKRTGSVGPAAFRETNPGGKACSVEGCDGRSRVQGLCHAHYERAKRNGSPGGAIARQEPAPKDPCAVNGCAGDAEVRGWCRRHYKRWWDCGDPGPADFQPRRTGCQQDGCNRPHSSSGWCELHYRRVRAGVRIGSLKFVAEPTPQDDDSYAAVHWRLRNTRGLARDYTCECGKPARQWAYQHNDPRALWSAAGHPYSLDLVGCYAPMCQSCHNLLDRDLDRRLAALT